MTYGLRGRSRSGMLPRNKGKGDKVPRYQPLVLDLLRCYPKRLRVSDNCLGCSTWFSLDSSARWNFHTKQFSFSFFAQHTALHQAALGVLQQKSLDGQKQFNNGTAAGRGAWTRDLVQRHKTTPKQREQHKIHESKNLRTANRFAWRGPFLHCRKSQPRHAAKTAQLHRVQLQRNCKRPPRTRRRDNKNSETASSAAHLSRSTRRPVTRTLTRQDRPGPPGSRRPKARSAKNPRVQSHTGTRTPGRKQRRSHTPARAIHFPVRPEARNPGISKEDDKERKLQLNPALDHSGMEWECKLEENKFPFERTGDADDTSRHRK